MIAASLLSVCVVYRVQHCWPVGVWHSGRIQTRSLVITKIASYHCHAMYDCTFRWHCWQFCCLVVLLPLFALSLWEKLRRLVAQTISQPTPERQNCPDVSRILGLTRAVARNKNIKVEYGGTQSQFFENQAFEDKTWDIWQLWDVAYLNNVCIAYNFVSQLCCCSLLYNVGISFVDLFSFQSCHTNDMANGLLGQIETKTMTKDLIN